MAVALDGGHKNGETEHMKPSAESCDSSWSLSMFGDVGPIDIEMRIEGAMFFFRPCSDEGRAFLEKEVSDARRIGDAVALRLDDAVVVISQILDERLRLRRVVDPESTGGF